MLLVQLCMFQSQKLFPDIQKKINWLKMQLLLWIVLVSIYLLPLFIYVLHLIIFFSKISVFSLGPVLADSPSGRDSLYALRIGCCDRSVPPSP